MWRLVGLDPHEPTLLISSPKFQQITPESIIYLNPTRIHNDFELILSQLRIVKPEALRGNPLAVLEFCWLIRKQQIHDISFRTAVLYGHVLSDGMRLFIEKTLGCKVFSTYALGEIGAVAGECRFQKGHHVIVDGIIVEVTDQHGNILPYDTTGQILITDLTNYVMPLIRYVTGDRGRFLQNLCPCGKSSPLLLVDGREEEMFVCPDGTLVFGGSTRDILDHYSDTIEQYQIIQKEAGEFLVRLRPSSYFDKAVETNIFKDLKKLLGAEVTIKIEYVTIIPLEPSGKFKQFVSLAWKKRFPSGTFSDVLRA